MRWWLLFAAFLLVAGAVLPALMVLKIIASSVALSVLAYGASVAGFILGSYAVLRHLSGPRG